MKKKHLKNLQEGITDICDTIGNIVNNGFQERKDTVLDLYPLLKTKTSKDFKTVPVPVKPETFTSIDFIILQIAKEFPGIYLPVKLWARVLGFKNGTIKNSISKLTKAGYIKTTVSKSRSWVRSFSPGLKTVPLLQIPEKRFRTTWIGVKRRLQKIVLNLEIYNSKTKEPQQDGFLAKLKVEQLQDIIEFLYPHLHATGFNGKDLKRIMDTWQVQGLNLDALPLALEKMNHWIERKKDIQNPKGYIIASLMRADIGTPPDFKSRAEQIHQLLVETNENIKQIEESKIHTEFEMWWNSLDKDHQDRIDKSILPPKIAGILSERAKTIMRKQYYINHLKQNISDNPPSDPPEPSSPQK